MARTAFTNSPGAHGQQRKFCNPTGGFVGANVFGPGGEPTAISVEPGGEVWLTEEEERMTAEAPYLAENNPFVKQWEEPVDFDSFGEPTRYVTRTGILVLSDAPPRPVASDRFVPERAPAEDVPRAATPDYSAEELRAMLAEKEAAEPKEETVKGADVPEPTQPAPQGQPSPDEIVGTPDAVAANDKAVSKRKATAEQPVATGAIPT